MMSAYDWTKRALFSLEAETAHRLVSEGLKTVSPSLSWLSRLGMLWGPEPQDHCEVFGVTFRSRLGLAAGFDKNAELIPALAALGFGSVEIGTVTPRPQGGNPRPRLFREPETRSLWNRMGFNNDGAAAIAQRIKAVREKAALPPHFRIGVNVGKNKDTPADQAAQDYLEAASRFTGLADYLVINVSSPNTPGLRDLQEVDFLEPLLKALRERVGSIPCLLKVAPELSEQKIEGLISGLDRLVDGWIVSNTLRGEGPSGSGSELGGWSGGRLESQSRWALSQFLRFSSRPVISVGGIASPEDAQGRIQRGASLLQVYSAWVYDGPSLPRVITEALRKE
jgi:dihydroorotate dehydrogenase